MTFLNEKVKKNSFPYWKIPLNILIKTLVFVILNLTKGLIKGLVIVKSVPRNRQRCTVYKKS